MLQIKFNVFYVFVLKGATCKDCPAEYMGQSDKNINIRITEHKETIVDRKINRNIYTCFDDSHFVDPHNTKLPRTENTSQRGSGWNYRNNNTR